MGRGCPLSLHRGSAPARARPQHTPRRGCSLPAESQTRLSLPTQSACGSQPALLCITLFRDCVPRSKIPQTRRNICQSISTALPTSLHKPFQRKHTPGPICVKPFLSKPSRTEELYFIGFKLYGQQRIYLMVLWQEHCYVSCFTLRKLSKCHWADAPVHRQSW